MEKIWVVEQQGNEGTWYPAIGGDNVLAYNNFYAAHRARRLQYQYLKSVAPKVWTWKRIRVQQWSSPLEFKMLSYEEIVSEIKNLGPVDIANMFIEVAELVICGRSYIKGGAEKSMRYVEQRILKEKSGSCQNDFTTDDKTAVCKPL